MQKMVRCAEMNIGKAFMYWQLEWRRTKEKEALAKRNGIISAFVVCLQKKYDKNRKVVFIALTAGVSLLKSQQTVLNQIHYAF